MGKFSDALSKSEKGKAAPSSAPEPQKSARKIAAEEVRALKMDTSAEQKLTETVLVPNNGMDARLLHFLEPNSVASECFKMLRAKIFTLKAGARPRAIMVTSPQPLDGKSTVAANLAIHFAQGLNEHVILVDCDLRRPTLSKLFGINSHQGLSNYLDEGTSISDYLVQTKIAKLALLPAGRTPENPSELLSSEKMRRLVEELKSRYEDRYIIFDATPAEGAAETTSLSHMMDSILLVVRSGRTTKERILKAVENVDRERILGVVFNGSHEPARDYKYYYGYYRKARKP